MAAASASGALLLPENSFVPVRHALHAVASEAETRRRSTRPQPLPLASIPDLTAVYFGRNPKQPYDADGMQVHMFLPAHAPKAPAIPLSVDVGIVRAMAWGAAYELQLVNGRVDRMPQPVGRNMKLASNDLLLDPETRAMYLRGTQAKGRGKAVEFARPTEAQQAMDTMEVGDITPKQPLVLQSVINMPSGRLYAVGLPSTPAMRDAPSLRN